MTTVAEDLKTTIDTDWGDALGKTTYVFMKVDQDTTQLEPPNPATDSVRIVIIEGNGIPIRYTKGADLMVYEGELHVFAVTYANMITALAELKQIADNLLTGVGDLSFTIPAIKGEEDDDLFVATIKYKWEKLTARG